MTGELSIREIDPADDAALEQHVAFQRAHGRPRHGVDELRAWLPTVDRAVLLIAEDDSGSVVGCASASILQAIANCVQLNAFFLPGRVDVLEQLAQHIVEWAAFDDPVQLLAHVSDPTPDQEDTWRRSSFAYQGSRSRLKLDITMATPPPVELPAGIEIAAAPARPDLEEQAVALWNEAVQDIPTPIPFTPVSRATWRRDLEIPPDGPLPDLLIFAVSDANELAGLALLLPTEGAGIRTAGHRLTAVARSWRGRGVAIALKQALIHSAREHGYERLVASNDDDNPAMLAINQRLHYEPMFRIAMYQRSAI